MAIDNINKGSILVEALPYIQEYYKKTVVVKYGGNAMTSPELKKAVIRDVVLLSLVGVRVVLVHGGGPEISDMLKKIGKKSEFKDGMRVTDRETMDVVQMVLAGKVNKDLVNLIEECGGHAVGLCGVDGSLFCAKQLGNGEYGYVGEITKVNPGAVVSALDAGNIPVVATVARGEDGSDCYNVNADIAAAQLAVAMQAEKLILITDIRGILRDKDDDSTLISVIHPSEMRALIDEKVVAGGMIPKVQCCMDALAGGVRRAYILDGRVLHSILIEMLSDEGVGTMITGDDAK